MGWYISVPCQVYQSETHLLQADIIHLDIIPRVKVRVLIVDKLLWRYLHEIMAATIGRVILPTIASICNLPPHGIDLIDTPFHLQ